jgi:hypothetical protein
MTVELAAGVCVSQLTYMTPVVLSAELTLNCGFR